jgi:small redox-active disulfide protein 2
MLSVKVLGTGCAKCDKLFALTQQAIDAAGVQAELTKVSGLDDIMAYGVMLTPALVIDEQVVSSGRLPKPTQIAQWLSAAAGD